MVPAYKCTLPSTALPINPHFLFQILTRSIFFPVASYGGKYNERPLQAFTEHRKVLKRQCQFAGETYTLNLRQL